MIFQGWRVWTPCLPSGSAHVLCLMNGCSIDDNMNVLSLEKVNVQNKISPDQDTQFACLFVLMLYNPVNNFH